MSKQKGEGLPTKELNEQACDKAWEEIAKKVEEGSVKIPPLPKGVKRKKK